MAFRVGSKVKWAWYGSFIHGRVEEVFHEAVTKTIKGKKITRRGSKETPAYLVKSDAGNLALKLQTELEKDAKQTPSSPRMFQDP
ncbi:hypervirulence associated TUDOR domain-containing protein [Bdellovibrio reynosensis]|uniref:DUF2945 domain-containing protein n=1 Tax=Bdellovibrio reynosensis TaxID=2835041 RepID=A0ABY4CDV1_9BACT|nr:DUF2945 domain-containing protein [Bdellovibrio reynosensis]UOF02904.1 DUF2945 domain-containing protein [Bdellovibrio reynosensis]